MPPPGRLRIGVLGKSRPAEDWTWLLADAAEVVESDTLATLFESGVDLILAVAEPDAAATLAGEVAESPKPPPVTLLVASAATAHPHARLVRAIVTAKRQWEGAFDAMVDPVVVLEPDGRVRRANRALGRALARELPGLVGLSAAELLGNPQGPDPIAKTLADNEPRTLETRYPRLGGVQQVTASPYVDETGASQGVVAILKDVTAIREQQDHLLLAGRMADIGRLAAGVAHEINTPLASIALRAESLLKLGTDPRLAAIDAFEKFPRYLRTIDEEIFRCKKIIAALLDFSRAHAPEARETDLNLLAEKAVDLLSHQMRLKQVELTLALEKELPKLKADDGQLRQVLVALLMNALDASRPGGTVGIETRSGPADHVTLVVSDTGSGIPPEHRDSVFSPFFTTKPVGQGTGLGLAICHGIVTAHGGTIAFDSEPEKGTRITIQLPIAGAAPPRPPAPL